MNLIHTHNFVGLLHDYGYLALAVVVGLESLGLPLPGEGLLIAASLYAGTTHHMDPVLVMVAAALGAIVGQTAGYWIGLSVGFRLLRRYGHRIGLPWRRLALGRILFRKHGIKVVIVGRFVIVLRVIAAILAGANQMPWPRFMLANVIGSVAWAAFYAIGVSLLGKQMKHMAGPIGIGVGLLGLLVIVASIFVMHRQERRMTSVPLRGRRTAS